MLARLIKHCILVYNTSTIKQERRKPFELKFHYRSVVPVMHGNFFVENLLTCDIQQAIIKINQGGNYMEFFLYKVISVCKYLLLICCFIYPFNRTIFLLKIILVLILFILTYFLIIEILDVID